MKLSARLGLTLVSLALPVIALAAPGNVSGITASMENGAVRVTWTKLNDPNIVAYRIFYSHASILGNNGTYDDFESVDTSVTSHLLTNLPASSEVFVSILAVNNIGEESPFFVEEASVKTGMPQQAQSSSAQPVTMPSSMTMTMASSSSSQAPVVQEVQETNELRLLSVEAISNTGIVLRFSHSVSIPTEVAAQAITISTGSGKLLGMRRFIIQGNTVTVHTAVQERFRVYQVIVSSVITGTLTNGQTVLLAPDQAPALFSGHATGLEQTNTQPLPISDKPEVMQLRLRAQPDGSTYVIDATWQVPAASGVTGYSIAQTTDGGRTFSTARTVSPGTTAVKINGVPAGQFGILIKTIYADGTTSTGASQIIALPALQGGTQGSVTGGSGTLPDSGPALWVLVMVAGAVAGVWRMKRLSAVVA